MSWSTSELSVRLESWNRLKPSRKIFLLTVPSWYFFCGSFVVFTSRVCHATASVHCYLVVTCWERADVLSLVCDVILPLSHVVSWVRYRTWLYWFLIFTTFLLCINHWWLSIPLKLKTTHVCIKQAAGFICVNARIRYRVHREDWLVLADVQTNLRLFWPHTHTKLKKNNLLALY